MPTNILEASVSLYAEDARLRASFQGLAPQAHLAGVTVGERFAAGVASAASRAHEAFKKNFIGPIQSTASQKDFIGPMQSEFFEGGPGRGMAPYLAARQYGAASKEMASAVHGSTAALQEHAVAQGVAGQAARGALGWHSSQFREFREGIQITRHLTSALLTELSPALASVVQGALQTSRAGAQMGVGFALAVGAGIGIAEALGKISEKAKEAAKFQTDLSIAFNRASASGTLALHEDTSGKFAGLGTAASDILDRSLRPGIIDSYVDFFRKAHASILLLTTDTKELEERLKASAAQFKLLFEVFEGPKIQLETRHMLLAAQGQSIGLSEKEARSIGDIEAVERRRLRNIEVQFEVDKRRIELHASEQATPLRAVGLFGAADAIVEDGRKKVEAARVASDNQVKESVLSTRASIIGFEEMQMGHAVEMGRVSMLAQLEFARAASTDPRRTVKEQLDAETKANQLRHSMAEEYFKFQGNLGKSMWREQLEVARGFLSEMAAGGQPWLNQTQKIFDLYKGMREQAQGIFSSQVGIGEGEASRQGKTSISMDDLPDLIRKVRERDERALGGGRVAIGDLSGAVGRVDLFRTIDREGLGPREAFSRMMADPSRQVAQLSEMGNAASIATRALLGMADVLGQVGAGRGGGLSEANRGALVALKPADSSALGRGLFLEAQRGPATTQTMP